MVLEKNFGLHVLSHKYKSFKLFILYASRAYKNPMKAFNFVSVKVYFLPKT